jgi:hypothetical protein
MIKGLLFGFGETTRRLVLDGWSCRVEWKLRDMWVGLYWATEGHCLDAWVCLLPCVPIHVSMWWHDPRQ